MANNNWIIPVLYEYFAQNSISKDLIACLFRYNMYLHVNKLIK